VELNRRIFSGLLVPVVLLAIWVCPCSKPASAAAQVSAHKCCESKNPSAAHEKSKSEKDCPHCTGGPSVTTSEGKVAAHKVNLHKLLPALVYDPLYLVQMASLDPCDNEQCFHPPSAPIRLMTCTFLF